MKLKRDPYFHYVAVLIFAGVILAFVDPTPAAATLDKLPAVVTAVTHAQLEQPGQPSHRDQS